jgi:hypothetical protein
MNVSRAVILDLLPLYLAAARSGAEVAAPGAQTHCVVEVAVCFRHLLYRHLVDQSGEYGRLAHHRVSFSDTRLSVAVRGLRRAGTGLLDWLLPHPPRSAHGLSAAVAMSTVSSKTYSRAESKALC